MSQIKNRFFEEINKRADKIEDEEYFYEQKVKLKPIYGNGKEKQGDKAHQNDKKR
ncbi:MAG: hypothetical protein K2X86_08870 [Cytophagaceae bacterium]|nr:hypothetical protein [Cytophagaceae bacterium]